MKHLALLLLLALPVAVLAEPVRFRTFCPSPDPEIASLFYLPAPAGAAVEVELPAANFTLARYTSSTREIRLFAGNPGPESTPAAVARVPDGVRDAIVMLLPEGTPGRFRAMVFDASLATFRAGDHQFLNLSPDPVGIDLGGEKLSLEPGKTGTIRKAAADGAVRLPLQMFQRSGDEWERFSATRVTLDPRIRSLVVIYPDPAEARLRARVVHDRVDSPTDPAS